MYVFPYIYLSLSPIEQNSKRRYQFETTIILLTRKGIPIHLIEHVLGRPLFATMYTWNRKPCYYRMSDKSPKNQLTQKPTHPRTNSPKLWPTHPNGLVNSPKYLVNTHPSFWTTHPSFKTNEITFRNFLVVKVMHLDLS